MNLPFFCHIIGMPFISSILLLSKSRIVLASFLSIILCSGCGHPVQKTQSITLPVSDVNTMLDSIDCTVCERISLFIKSKELIANSIWKGLNDETKVAPLLYFTDSTTYYFTALNDETFSADEFRIVNCQNGLTLKKLKARLDKQPFHMENKMNFGDTSSLFYFRPMMLCSDVETMSKFVPVFSKTEDWLQLVMHEYFHSFQFSHKNFISYLANTIQIGADTLDKIYNNNDWFEKRLRDENQLLLSAIQTTDPDSINYYVEEFFDRREKRRKKCKEIFGLNFSDLENFWETVEGTARYSEYYLAGNFKNIPLTEFNNCDPLFQHFRDYNDSINFEDKKEFRERTQIMQAYYYVTGFNLCRLMDKMGVQYKHMLFDKPRNGLYEILRNAKH